MLYSFLLIDRKESRMNYWSIRQINVLFYLYYQWLFNQSSSVASNHIFLVGRDNHNANF